MTSRLILGADSDKIRDNDEKVNTWEESKEEENDRNQSISMVQNFQGGF